MDVQQLARVVSSNEAADALPWRLTEQQWREFASYLGVQHLSPGDTLLREGERGQELFILAEGELNVMFHQHVLATVSPGGVVGEGSFFSGLPRSATVSCPAPAVAWSLTREKFDALARQHERLAVQIVIGLATVLAIRMRHALHDGRSM